MTGIDELTEYFRMLILSLLVMVIGGCSSPNSDSMSIFDIDTGSHPTGWISSHSVSVSSDGGECAPCHSDSLDGGIALVSCLTSDCHHGTIPSWSSPLEHGASAKSSFRGSGFISCQLCHGTDFSGGLSGMDCFLCHTTAPHPSNWLPGDFFIHTDTAEENSPACAECHMGGNNSPDPPPPAPSAGTPPGCYNDTLCHGA